MDNVQGRLVKCFMAMFPELTAEKALSASTNTLRQWDSLSSVTLFTLIEEEFGISLSVDALDEFGSFAQVFAYLEKERFA